MFCSGCFSFSRRCACQRRGMYGRIINFKLFQHFSKSQAFLTCTIFWENSLQYCKTWYSRMTSYTTKSCDIILLLQKQFDYSSYALLSNRLLTNPTCQSCVKWWKHSSGLFIPISIFYRSRPSAMMSRAYWSPTWTFTILTADLTAWSSNIAIQVSSCATVAIWQQVASHAWLFLSTHLLHSGLPQGRSQSQARTPAGASCRSITAGPRQRKQTSSLSHSPARRTLPV